jgi:hypothetical protein
VQAKSRVNARFDETDNGPNSRHDLGQRQSCSPRAKRLALRDFTVSVRNKVNARAFTRSPADSKALQLPALPGCGAITSSAHARSALLLVRPTDLEILSKAAGIDDNQSKAARLHRSLRTRRERTIQGQICKMNYKTRRLSTYLFEIIGEPSQIASLHQ